MTYTAPGIFKYTENQVEPTSIANPPVNVEQPYPPLEVATCTLPGCAGDPGAEGRLDEISFMLERCRQDPNATTPSWWEWPWRQPAS
jgi:hypothetical protein